MKGLKLCFLFFGLISLTACAKSIREVSIYVPEIDEKYESRYKELKNKFNSQTNKNFTDKSKDPEFNEFLQLDLIYGTYPKNMEKKGQLSALVDLKNHQLLYNQKSFPYKEENNEIIFKKIPESDIAEKYWPKLVQAAKDDYSKAERLNTESLIKLGWLPLLIFIAGLLGIFKPTSVWYLEDGYKYQDSQPSKLIRVINQSRGYFAILLALFLAYLLWQNRQ